MKKSEMIEFLNKKINKHEKYARGIAMRDHTLKLERVKALRSLNEVRMYKSIRTIIEQWEGEDAKDKD